MINYDDFFGPTCKIPEHELLSVWEKYIETRDGDACERLLHNYKDIVFQIAERLVQGLPRHIDVADLLSPGMLGLLKAIERYDPGKGYKFCTFAGMRVRGEILDDLRRLDPVPRSVRQQNQRIEETRRQLDKKIGRPCSDDELARELMVTVPELRKMICESRIHVPGTLDKTWTGDDGQEHDPAEMLPDPCAVNPLDELMRKELKAEALRGLSEDAQRVVVMYYYDNMNMKEIGAAINKSESRVCQIHTQSLEFIRKKYDQLMGKDATY